MRVYIYTLSDPETGFVRYVGKTINTKTRFWQHLRTYRSNTHKSCWLRSLASRGLRPILDVIEEFESGDDDWQESERFWISYLRFLGCDLCNLDAGGIGGCLKTEETKKKISMRKKGKKLSPEHVEKIRNRVFTDEWRQNLSKSKTGRRISEETKRKLSAASLGVSKSKEHAENIGKARRGMKYRARNLAKDIDSVVTQDTVKLHPDNTGKTKN